MIDADDIGRKKWDYFSKFLCDKISGSQRLELSKFDGVVSRAPQNVNDNSMALSTETHILVRPYEHQLRFVFLVLQCGAQEICGRTSDQGYD